MGSSAAAALYLKFGRRKTSVRRPSPIMATEKYKTGFGPSLRHFGGHVPLVLLSGQPACLQLACPLGRPLNELWTGVIVTLRCYSTPSLTPIHCLGVQ